MDLLAQKTNTCSAKYIKFNEIVTALTTNNSPRLTMHNSKHYPQIIPYVDEINKKINLPSQPYMFTSRLDFKEISNSISVSIMKPDTNFLEKLSIIETNIDDMSPEIVPYLMEKIQKNIFQAPL